MYDEDEMIEMFEEQLADHGVATAKCADGRLFLFSRERLEQWLRENSESELFKHFDQRPRDGVRHCQLTGRNVRAKR